MNLRINWESFLPKILWAAFWAAIFYVLDFEGAALIAAAPYTTGFLGMRGTGDWSTDERPYNWREMILRLFPSGAAPLTAIMSKLSSQSTDDPRFNWFQKDLAAQGGYLQSGQDGGGDVYIDQLSTAYVYATHQATYGIAGATVYVNLPEAIANHIRPKHIVTLRDSDRRSDVDVQGHVRSVVKAGSSSYIVVKLIEADDNSADSDNYNLATVDEVWISGNAQPEGANMPQPVAYDPSPLYNLTQIFMTTLSITRTAQKTRLRSANAYEEAKMESLQYHSIEQEMSWIFSERYETTGDNSQPLRFGRGLINWIRSDSDAVRSDFALETDAAYSGKTWLQAGEDWFDDKLEVVKRWNDQRMLAGICGSGFMRGVNRLAKATGQIMLEPMDAAYGLQISRWLTNGLTIALIDHPLFNFRASDRKKCLIFDPRRISFRFIDDTNFYEDPTTKVAGYTKRDARDELWLTEGHLEVHHAKSMALLDGAGLDNDQS